MTDSRYGHGQQSDQAQGRWGDDASSAATPGQTSPWQSGPDQSNPWQTTPAQTGLGQSSPWRTSPGQANPGQANPGQANPGQANPRQANPGHEPAAAYPSQTSYPGPPSSGPVSDASGPAAQTNYGYQPVPASSGTAHPSTSFQPAAPPQSGTGWGSVPPQSAGYQSTGYQSNWQPSNAGYQSNGQRSNAGYQSSWGHQSNGQLSNAGHQSNTGYQPAAYVSPQRAPGRASTIVIAALTALVVGAAAGLGGSVLGATLLGGQPQVAQGPPAVEGAPVPPTVVAVAERMLPSTVMIRIRTGQGTSTGSGFVLDAEGRIMTNNHVIDSAATGGTMTVEFSDGTRVAGEVVGRSPSYDIGIIKVDPQEVPRLVPSELGDSSQVKVGDTVVAIGAPLGLEGTVTEGIISAKDRPVAVGSQNSPSYINGLQTDASINMGNSGGPLIDAAGRVIGVNSAILTVGEAGKRSGSVGLGFAIPIKEARAIGEEIIATGKAKSPTIGAKVQPEGEGEGARIDTFEKGSTAEAAGLQEGDVLTAVGDRPVADHVELIVAIRSYRPGEVVTLRYTRSGVPAEAQVTLGEKEG